MNIPSIPTDNLYKFCAVTGVVLLLFSVIFPFQKIFDNQNNLDQFTTEVKILTAQIAHLEEDIQRLNSNFDSLEKEITAAKDNSGVADLSLLGAKNAATATKFEALNQKRRQIAIFNIKQQGSFDHLTHLVQRLWLYLTATAASMLGGLMLALFGFNRWYDRVQKPADDLLQRQIGKNIS